MSGTNPESNYSGDCQQFTVRLGVFGSRMGFRDA
jgi:hypothetical protein